MKKMRRAIAFCLTLVLALGMLAGCGKTTVSTDGSVYQVLVVDEAGNPVPGAMIQFCSDTECMTGKTDNSGISVFEKEAGSYTVHVLKVPEGFQKNDTEYTAPAEPGPLTVVLQAENSADAEHTESNGVE